MEQKLVNSSEGQSRVENQSEQTARKLEGQLRAIGLYQKGIGKKITSWYIVEGSQPLNIELWGGKGKVEALVAAKPPFSSLDLIGYQVMVRREAPEIGHFVLGGKDTAELEKKFAVIDYSQIKVAEYRGQDRLTGNVHYDHLLSAMNELADLYEFARDGAMIHQLNELRNGIYINYGAGNGFEDHLIRHHRGWRDAFYEQFTFPPHLHIEELQNENTIHRLAELAELAWATGPKTREIMNANNLEHLKEEMIRLGFSEDLIGRMQEKMEAGEPKFILYDELQGEKGRVEMALHFNQSRTSEYYYFNKFDLVKEIQPPLSPGEKYFVSSQRQSEEVMLKEFEMPALAVREFNARMAASEHIRGAAQLYAGKSLADSRELATMGDGKLINVDPAFYKTLKDPAPAMSCYVEKGNGFTLAQGLNLLAGRSVYRADMLDIKHKEYSAWVKLDFDGDRDKNGTLKTKNFTEGYGFDLSAVLDRFDFKELGSADKRAALEATLMNGDRAVVTVDLGGKKEAILVEALPEFKQVNLYSLEGRSIKREQHMKEEKIAEVSLGKDKSVKKEQEQGLGV